MTLNKVLGVFISFSFSGQLGDQICLKWILIQSGYSRRPILTWTTIFFNFVTKIVFLGRFGHGSSQWFLENENMYKQVLRGADFNDVLDGS